MSLKTAMPRLLFAFALLALALPAAAQHEIQQPKGTWQKPGEIQQPKGPWQTPGEIQVPKGIQAIHAQEETCTQRFQVISDALFDFDKATLSPSAEETLNALLPLLAKAGKHPARVEGHTDAKGSDAYNQRLSERRAQAVVDYLVKAGVARDRLEPRGFGESQPIADNATDDGQAQNRRVELRVLGP